MQIWAFFTPHASWRLSITSDIFNTYGVSGLERVSNFSSSVVNLQQIYIYIYLFILLFPLYNRHGLKSNPEPFEQKSCLLTAVCIAYWAQVCTLTEFRSKAANRVTDMYIGRCVDRAQDAGWETAVGTAIRYRVSGSGVRTPLWAGDFILSTPI